MRSATELGLYRPKGGGSEPFGVVGALRRLFDDRRGVAGVEGIGWVWHYCVSLDGALPVEMVRQMSSPALFKAWSTEDVSDVWSCSVRYVVAQR